jgi:type IV pilus assembly protein PilW
MEKTMKTVGLSNIGGWQRGFTLVEILVALTLGLFVIGGVIQIFATTRQTYRTQEQISQLQENARVAINFLNDNIRLAGYRALASGFRCKESTCEKDKQNITLNGAFPSNADFSGKAGKIVIGQDNNLNNNDSITLRYRGNNDGSVTDCFGRTADSKQTITITLSLSSKDKNEKGEEVPGRSLRCLSRITGDNAPADWGPEPLVTGIEAMEILYGVDMQRTSFNATASTYISAKEVDTNPDWWNRVVSVRVILLLTTADNVAPDKQSYFFPPWSAKPTASSDNRLRRVFTTTVHLRNTEALPR